MHKPITTYAFAHGFRYYASLHTCHALFAFALAVAGEYTLTMVKDRYAGKSASVVPT